MSESGKSTWAELLVQFRVRAGYFTRQELAARLATFDIQLNEATLQGYESDPGRSPKNQFQHIKLIEALIPEGVRSPREANEWLKLGIGRDLDEDEQSRLFPSQPALVQLTLNGRHEDWNDTRQEETKSSLAGLLAVSKEDVQILCVVGTPLVLTLLIPAFAARYLLLLHLKGATVLRVLKIDKVVTLSERLIFSVANLSGADLRGVDLVAADLSGANLSGANLSGTNLNKTDLSGTDLARADLSDTFLHFANLGGADLSGANLGGAKLLGALLTKANLNGANLLGADLLGVDLTSADLGSANLSAVDLSGIDFFGANLRKADLSGAELLGAGLSGVDLSGANLSNANLSGANLSRANLSNADLSGANLSGTYLHFANFSSSDLNETLLPFGPEELEPYKLRYDKQTNWPWSPIYESEDAA